MVYRPTKVDIPLNKRNQSINICMYTAYVYIQCRHALVYNPPEHDMLWYIIPHTYGLYTMPACIHTYGLYTRACLHIYKCMYVSTYIWIYIGKYVCMYVYVYIYVRLYAFIYLWIYLYMYICIHLCLHARGVMVIVVGNEHGDTSSNPGWDWLHFT